jgi:hypothetical protein
MPIKKGGGTCSSKTCKKEQPITLSVIQENDNIPYAHNTIEVDFNIKYTEYTEGFLNIELKKRTLDKIIDLFENLTHSRKTKLRENLYFLLEAIEYRKIYTKILIDKMNGSENPHLRPAYATLLNTINETNNVLKNIKMFKKFTNETLIQNLNKIKTPTRISSIIEIEPIYNENIWRKKMHYVLVFLMNKCINHQKLDLLLLFMSKYLVSKTSQISRVGGSKKKYKL